jgi:hypothetical protein
MKNNHKKIWHCVMCGQHTTTLHEVHFGTAGREVCVQYSIQTPVCPLCHLEAHGNITVRKPRYSQEEFKRIFCEKLGISYEDSKLGVETQEHRHLLAPMKKRCEEMLESWEV